MPYTDYSKKELILRLQELEAENKALSERLNCLEKNISPDYANDVLLQLKLTSSLLEAAKQIPSCSNFTEKAGFIFNQLKNLLNADAGYIALLNKDTGMNEVVHLEPGSQECRVNPELPMPVRGFRATVYKSKKVSYHNNFQHSKWAKLMPEGHTVLNNVMFVPMIINNDVVGLIGLSNKPGGFTDTDAEMAREFAILAVIALNYSNKYDENIQYLNKLKESEEKFRSMIEDSPVMIWESGVDAKCNYFNKRWLEFRGRLMSEEVGDGWIEGIHPEDYDACVNGYLRSFQKREKFKLENRLKNADGIYRWIMDIGVPQFNTDGTFKGYLGSCIDITEQKLFEQIQKEKEEFYYALFEKNKAVKLLIDPISGKIIDANTAASECYGYSLSALQAMKITDINQLSKEQVAAEMQKALKEKKKYFEFRHKLADGEIRDVAVYSGPVNYKGKDLLYSIINDITEGKKAENKLKENEEKYRNLYEKTPVMLHSIDSEGKLISVSDYWLKKMGYNKDEVIGRKSLEFLTPKSQEKFHKYFPAFKEKGEIYNMAYQMVKKNGELMDVHLSAISEKNVDGTLKRTLAVIIDVTEQKKAEEELKKAYNLYRTLVSNLPGINTYLFDTDKRIIIAEGAEFKEGIYSRSDFEGRIVTELNIEKYVKDYLDNLFTAALQGERISSELHYEDTWYYYVAVPVKDHKNNVLGGINVSQNITPQKLAYNEIENYKDKLKHLTRYLQQIIEKEKTALAREIHDELGQNLTFVKLTFALLNKKLTKERNASELIQLQNAYEMIDNLIKKVKKVTSELRPALIDDLGIIAAMEWYLNEFTTLTGIKYTFDYTNEDLQLDKDLAINLYRILQEALTNCVKYAKATDLNVSLNMIGDELVFKIHNNGIGIKEKEIKKMNSFGITGMRERVDLFNGSFSIKGSAKGTFIDITIPLK